MYKREILIKYIQPMQINLEVNGAELLEVCPINNLVLSTTRYQHLGTDRTIRTRKRDISWFWLPK